MNIKKNNKVLFMLPSILVFLFIALYPIFKIMVDVKNVESIYFSLLTILGLLIFIFLCIAVFVEEIYLLYCLYTKIEMKIIFKILWTLALLLFNILVIPLFYMKYITKENKIVFKTILYVVPIIIFSLVFVFGYKSYIEDITKIKAERKRIEEERNIYRTKDNIAEFTFRHGYNKEEVGEYDLYVKNNEKNIVFTSFTYDTTLYEQSTVDEFINKGISDIGANKEKFDLFKEKKVEDLEDKTITTIEYKGKTKESSMCVYRITVIAPKNKPDYFVYVVEVITEKNYDLYLKELDEIIKTSKFY